MALTPPAVTQGAPRPATPFAVLLQAARSGTPARQALVTACNRDLDAVASAFRDHVRERWGR